MASSSLCKSLRWRAERLHRKGHVCPSPPCPFEEEADELRTAADEIDRLRMALELIARDVPTVEWSAPGGPIFTRFARTYELREIAQKALAHA